MVPLEDTKIPLNKSWKRPIFDMRDICLDNYNKLVNGDITDIETLMKGKAQIKNMREEQ